MKPYRSLIILLLVLVIGVIGAQWMLHDTTRDFGQVLVRIGGNDYLTSLPRAALILLIALLALNLLWQLLTLPFRVWGRYRRRQARARLIEGLNALQAGHWARAEKLLASAASDPEVGAVALTGAAEAAEARGDEATLRRYLDQLAVRDPGNHALVVAKRALASGKVQDALLALDSAAIQPLPPRGLLLRTEALARSGRAEEAYGLLGALKQQDVLSRITYKALESRLATQSLREAIDANALAERWEILPKPLRADPSVVLAYANRAATLHWDDAATRSLEQALDANWDESLVALYGRLPVEKYDSRRVSAQRWLQSHPASPALLVTLARLARLQQQWPQAQDFLHRALAQGAGADAWEEFGHGFADAGNDAAARLCFANALRAERGEAPLELPTNRDLKQQIFDAAVGEERDEHGMPRLST